MHLIRFLAFYVVVYGHSLHDHSHLKKKRNAVPSRPESHTTQVLIIGAGISGLEAARLLQKNGIKSVTLEARNRTGGRIWSIHSQNGHVLDMGASYIHGIRGSIPSGLLTNPIWDLVQEVNISTRTREKQAFLGSYRVNESISVIRRWYFEYLTFVQEEIRNSSTNISLAYYANLFAEQQNFTESQASAFLDYLYFRIGVTEGTEIDTIGAKVYLEITSQHYGKEHVFPDIGFMSLTNYLAMDIANIRLGQVVTKVTYNETSVQVSTSAGETYQAEFILITAPLGVLKSKQIEFIPPLPQWKLDTIDRIGFGKYEKVSLLWERAWWNASNFYFVHPASQPNELRYWGNSHQSNGKPMITCVFAGKSADQLQSKQNLSEIVEAIRSDLQAMFPHLTIPPPAESYMSNWSQDPFSFGSYSYISLQQKYEDALYLSEPVDHRLLFAGEATSADTYGYTHGALLTARREVTRLLFIYDLLSEQNTTKSQSVMMIPSDIFALVVLAVYTRMGCSNI